MPEIAPNRLNYNNNQSIFWTCAPFDLPKNVTQINNYIDRYTFNVPDFRLSPSPPEIRLEGLYGVVLALYLPDQLLEFAPHLLQLGAHIFQTLLDRKGQQRRRLNFEFTMTKYLVDSWVCSKGGFYSTKIAESMLIRT